MNENTELKLSELNNNQILITGITWNKNSTRAFSSKKDNVELPTQFTLDLPENVVAQASKAENNYSDVIETFVYNFLTRRFSHEVYHCQIWLPLEK